MSSDATDQREMSSPTGSAELAVDGADADVVREDRLGDCDERTTPRVPAATRSPAADQREVGAEEHLTCVWKDGRQRVSAPLANVVS
jgi:hypothetical protein